MGVSQPVGGGGSEGPRGGQMTDEQAWLVANGLVVVKVCPGGGGELRSRREGGNWEGGFRSLSGSLKIVELGGLGWV